MSQTTPLIWALLGKRTGDNNQVLALVDELGLPFEPKPLGYRDLFGYDLGRIRPQYLGASLYSLDRESRQLIKPPWPDVVIGAGKRNVPVARYVRRMSRGQAKLVRIGNPRSDPDLFDLVITTPQYDVPPAANVLKLPVAMSRFRGRPSLGPADKAWLEQQPRPHLVLALGGDTRDVELRQDEVVVSAARLAARARSANGSLLIVGSPRTGPGLVEAVQPLGTQVPASGPSFAALLDDADEIHVTADSVSMVSEAIITGKPVGMIPARLSERGLRGVGERRKRLFDFRNPRRDPRNFWAELEQQGLVGTVDEPLCSRTENPVKSAARAVRTLLGDVG